MAFKKGHKPWNTGKKLPPSWNAGKKMDGYDYSNVGKNPNSLKNRFQKGHGFIKGGEKGWFKKGIQNNPTGGFLKGLIPWNKGKRYNNGEKHWNWQGGKSSLSARIRGSFEYKLWRKSVFERDNYTCIWCGQWGGKLHADHIKPFAHFPELRFAIDNGRTLCLECHKTTDTYLWKGIKKLP